jgi:hypothetical protein
MKRTLRVVQGQKRRNDPEKRDWVRLGIAWSDSKGTRIKLNALPLQDENGEVWINLFEEEKSSDEKKPDDVNDLDDEIPF